MYNTANEFIGLDIIKNYQLHVEEIEIITYTENTSLMLRPTKIIRRILLNASANLTLGVSNFDNIGDYVEIMVTGDNLITFNLGTPPTYSIIPSSIFSNHSTVNDVKVLNIYSGGNGEEYARIKIVYEGENIYRLYYNGVISITE